MRIKLNISLALSLSNFEKVVCVEILISLSDRNLSSLCDLVKRKTLV